MLVLLKKLQYNGEPTNSLYPHVASILVGGDIYKARLISKINSKIDIDKDQAIRIKQRRGIRNVNMGKGRD